MSEKKQNSDQGAFQAPSFRKCTPAYGVDDSVTSISEIDEEMLVCLLGELTRIHSALRMIVMLKEVIVSPYRANEPYVLDKILDRIDRALTTISRLK